MRKMIVIAMMFIFTMLKLNAQFISTVVSVTGNAFDANSNNPVAVRIDIYDSNNKKVNYTVSNSKDGYYFITGLRPGNKYEIRLSSPNFVYQTLPVYVPNTDKYTEISKDILTYPKTPGTEIPIKVKIFEPNKSTLKYGAHVFLDDYYNLLVQNPTMKAKIISYPDSDADKTKNETLTKQRSENIAKYLINKGIDSNRLITQGSSTIDPKNPIPTGKASKGKKYVGWSYIIIESI